MVLVAEKNITFTAEEQNFELSREHAPRQLSQQPREMDGRPVTHGPFVAKGEEQTTREHNRTAPVWYPGSYTPEALIFAEEKIAPLIADFEAYLRKKQDLLEARNNQKHNTDQSLVTIDEVRQILEEVEIATQDVLPKAEALKAKVYMALFKLYSVIDKKQPNRLADSISKDEMTPWRSSFYAELLHAIGFITLLKIPIDPDLKDLLERVRPIWSGGTSEAPNNRKLIHPKEIALAKIVLWTLIEGLPTPSPELLQTSAAAYLVAE